MYSDRPVPRLHSSAADSEHTVLYLRIVPCDDSRNEVTDATVNIATKPTGKNHGLSKSYYRWFRRRVFWTGASLVLLISTKPWRIYVRVGASHPRFSVCQASWFFVVAGSTSAFRSFSMILREIPKTRMKVQQKYTYVHARLLSRMTVICNLTSTSRINIM